MITEYLTSFGGLTVSQGWDGIDHTRQMPKVATKFDGEPWTDVFAQYLARPDVGQTTGLVIGTWAAEVFETADFDAMVAALAEAAPRMPRLRVLFVGDITFEEAEISWIESGDLGPVVNRFPLLDHLAIRGETNLEFRGVSLPRLTTLIVEGGGLDSGTLDQILASDLPELQHLDLFLGTPDYGGTTSVRGLRPLLDGSLFPKLRHLGLKDCFYGDELAAAVASSPVLTRVPSLDLSLGTIGNDGARALAASPMLSRLEQLNLSHHYIDDDDLKARLTAAVPTVDLSDQQTEEDYGRYVAIGE